MTDRHARTAVLGAGLAGCCIALSLAKRGVTIDLYDKNALPMLGASLHNEGKLHLGFVYANDPTGATHQLMVRGSLSFARILFGLTGVAPSELMPSRPFHYVVPQDSLLDGDTVEAHFHAVQESIDSVTSNTLDDRYLGLEHGEYWHRLSASELAAQFDCARCRAAFSTEERSVDTAAVASILRKAIAGHDLISFRAHSHVNAVNRKTANHVEVHATTNGDDSLTSYHAVANALWDDRLRVDKTAGVLPTESWLFRYKATILIEAPALARPIPSATLVLGPYGDVVNFGRGSYYLSWYPLCKLGESRALDARQLHDKAKDAESAHLVQSCVGALASYIPSLSQLVNYQHLARVGGGVIFAWGTADIDDPASQLHQRSKIGAKQHGAYVSVDTGKYCMAPLFALQAADMVIECLR